MSSPDKYKKSYADVVNEKFIRAWDQIEKAWERADGLGEAFDSIKFKLGGSQAGDTLLIVNATAADGTPMVAFCNGEGPREALNAFMRKIRNDDVRWKVDEWKQANNQ